MYRRVRRVLAVERDDPRFSPAAKAAFVRLYSAYRSQLAQGHAALPHVMDTGFRVCSQFDEDGLLLYLFAILGVRTGTFVDIGAGDGVNGSNCANLAINLGWHGLYIEGSQDKITAGMRYYSQQADTFLFPPVFKQAYVTPDNVNDLIRNCGFDNPVDLLSIDIDGHDYWVWSALECIRPRVVIIETHVEFGYHNIVVPYDPNYSYPPREPNYSGASPVAMVELARRKGYRLVGANRFGFNTIYLRDDEAADVISEISLETALRHPRNKERFALFEPIKDLPYVSGTDTAPAQ